MKLYLARHGEAEPAAINPERPLSPFGVEQSRRVALSLKIRGAAPAAVFHSGKARARQTAEIIAGSLAPGAPITILPGLEPDDPIPPIAKQANGFTGDTMLVGHLPFMEKLASWLLFGHEQAEPVFFSPGTVACLSRNGDAWSLNSVDTP